MATAKLEKVKDDFLTCAVCRDIFTDPCTLSCQHSFCRKCITAYTKTKAEAISSKAIICPSCRQMAKVPDPTKVVDEWAQQFKPGIVIVGLMDTMNNDVKYDGECEKCGLCEKIGERIKAVQWCHQCGISLCQRCVRLHGVHSKLCEHDLYDLDKKGKFLKKRNVFCKEHDGEEMKVHCRDCDIPICSLCAALYHRQCEDVVTIASMVDGMKSELSQVRNKLSKREFTGRKCTDSRRKQIQAIKTNREHVLQEIQIVCKKLRSEVRKSEKKLCDELTEMTAKEISDRNAEVKIGEIEVQTFGQFMEYLGQIINSNSEFDIYETYRSYKAGQLMINAEQNVERVSPTMTIKLLKNDVLTLMKAVLERKFKFEKDFQRFNPTSKLYDKFDFSMESDTKPPNLQDILVLSLDGKDTMIVTDIDNDCVKAFTCTGDEPMKHKFALESWPWGLEKKSGKRLLVAVPGNHEIITLEIRKHQLNRVSSIKTDQEYYSLAVLSLDTLVAGGDFCLDVLDMDGVRLRSMSSDGLFKYPWYMCVSDSHLYVSDSLRKTVTCLTLDGDVEWEYSSTEEGELVDPRGVSVTSDQDIIFADNELQKVLKVSKPGKHVEDVVVREIGLTSPRGLFDNGCGSVFVCEDNCIKEFV